MKKILFFIGGLHGGGAERALVELLKHFDYTRFQVTLCVVYYSGIYMNQIPKEVNVVYLFGEFHGYFQKSYQRKAFRYFLKHGNSLLLYLRLLYKIRERHFDTIISFIEGNALLFHYLIRHRGNRNISWVHCDLFDYHWTTNFFTVDGYERKCYESMDEIVFVANSTLNSFKKLYNINVPMRCIYNVVDVERIKMQSCSKKIVNTKITIIAIGSLIKIKGFERLLHVARMFKESETDVDFQILGIGEDEKALKDLCSSLDLDKSVHFLGFQAPPYPYLAAADILVSTSLSEALPFVICEALSLGIPVVATKTPGAIELLDNGKYGVLVEHDYQSIYEGLKMLVDDKGLRDLYKDKAKERSRIFDVTDTMEQVYNLIDGRNNNK